MTRAAVGVLQLHLALATYSVSAATAFIRAFAPSPRCHSAPYTFLALARRMLVLLRQHTAYRGNTQRASSSRKYIVQL